MVGMTRALGWAAFVFKCLRDQRKRRIAFPDAILEETMPKKKAAKAMERMKSGETSEVVEPRQSTETFESLGLFPFGKITYSNFSMR